MEQHPPAAGEQDEGGSGNAPSLNWIGFEFAPVKGVLSSRELTVEVAPANGGATALRADAEVVWFVNAVPVGEGVGYEAMDVVNETERRPLDRLLPKLVVGEDGDVRGRSYVTDERRL